MATREPVSPAFAALACRCPRCGRGKLFKGLLAITPACPACGLSFAGTEQGDGPAYFGILVIGTLAGIFASIVEVMFEPPFWLHAALWIPFIIGGSLISLRIGKAAIIAAQFSYRKDQFESEN